MFRTGKRNGRIDDFHFDYPKVVERNQTFIFGVDGVYGSCLSSVTF